MDPSRQFERLAKLSYDFQNQRIRRIEEVREGMEQEDFYDELFLHKEVCFPAY